MSMDKMPDGIGQLPAAAVRAQLEKVLSSQAFRGSKRCQAFLDFVVQRALDGRHEELKERVLAVEVFGRAPDSDLGDDTIVRVGAREVRKRLAQYYISEDGVADQVIIELPAGSYVPEWRWARTGPVPVPAAKPARQPSRTPWFVAGAGVLAVAAAALLWSQRGSGGTGAFETFWAPVLADESPLLVAMAHPIVYHLSNKAEQEGERDLPPVDVPVQRPIQLRSRVAGSDIVPVVNQYVGFGDACLVTKIAAFLAPRSRSVWLRFANQVEFSDLREGPVLLVGAFTNRWSLELNKDWRFRFVYGEDRRPAIRDCESGKQWTLASKTDDGLSQEDYIVLARMPRSVSGKFMLLGAGITQFGTETAGRVLSDPAQLEPLLARLPAGWDQKNALMILRAQVIGNALSPTEVIATYVW